MLKNRTLIGIILIAAAIGLCFGISPLFNSILSSKTKGNTAQLTPHCHKKSDML